MIENESVPLVRFEDNASAPIIRYDIPSPSSYVGTIYIETDIGKEYFGGDNIFKIDPGLSEEEKIKKKEELFKIIKNRFLKENQKELTNYLMTVSREELEKELDFYSMKEEEIGTEILKKAKLESARKAIEGAKIKLEQAQAIADDKQRDADSAANKFVASETFWNNMKIWYANQKKLPAYLLPNVKLSVDAAYYKTAQAYNQTKAKLNLIQQEATNAKEKAQQAQQELIKAEDHLTNIQEEPVSILSLMNTTGMGEAQAKYTLFKYLMDIAWKVDNSFPILNKTMGGKIIIKFAKLRNLGPKLIFVESHNLTNFPGDYGAGRIIKTFSLLPKEETEISISTWKKTTAKLKESSSILDSYTEEQADYFEKGISRETSRKSKEENSDSFNVGASVGASFGCASASASIGYESGTNSCREDCAKNTMNALSKHAQQSNAQRKVSIDTEFESTEETRDELKIKRKISNINASRTLNFTFRQMNQQFHSILHLTDLRIGFYNGYPGSFRSYTLPELSRYVFKYMNVPNKNHKEIFDDIKQKILKEYTNIIDYQGTSRILIEEISSGNGNTYLRVIPPKNVNGSKTGQQEYIIREEKRNQDGNVIQSKDIRDIDGIIISNKVITMKSDGIIVEALLGQANALDDYALESRKEIIVDDKLKNTLKKTEITKTEIGIELIRNLLKNNKILEAVDAFKDIFGVEESIKHYADLFEHPPLEIER